MIGMPFSRHSEMAVASMTASPRVSTSVYSMVSNLCASGCRTGSASYTPSTLVPLSRASALISSDRCAEVVSVEKNGTPRPAAKMTTRPFSRCLIARRRM
jgi:hypothetical protein